MFAFFYLCLPMFTRAALVRWQLKNRANSDPGGILRILEYASMTERPRSSQGRPRKAPTAPKSPNNSGANRHCAYDIAYPWMHFGTVRMKLKNLPEVFRHDFWQKYSIYQEKPRSSLHTQGKGEFFLAAVESQESPGGKRPCGRNVPQVKSGVPFLPSIGFAKRTGHANRLDQVHLLLDEDFPRHRAVKPVDDSARDISGNRTYRPVCRCPHRSWKFQQVNLADNKVISRKSKRSPAGGRVIDIPLI